MYPDNNPQTDPGNYLDQIATKQTQKSGLFGQKPLTLALMALGGTLVLFFLLMAVGSMFGNNGDSMKLFAGRLQATKSIADSATTNIKNTQLRAINSNLEIILTNVIHDATPILSKQNIDITNLDQNTKSQESASDMLSTLEDARLNAIYDRTYAREMAYKLDTLLSLMKQIYNNSSDNDLKNFFGQAYNNIAPIQQQLASYSDPTTD